MMDELLKELQPLVAHETARASNQYGDKYASAHEAESVLREEITELMQASAFCNNDMEHITTNLQLEHKLDGNDESDTKVYELKAMALNAAAEAVQVAAVCEKIHGGFEK